MSDDETNVPCRLPSRVFVLLLLAIPPASPRPSNVSSSSELCSARFPPAIFPNVFLDCPSLKAFLRSEDGQHHNVSSLRLDCEGKDEAQQRVLDRLTEGHTFRWLKNLSLVNCGPSSARFSRLSQLEELDFGLSELARLDWQRIESTHLHLLKIGRFSAVGGCEECHNKWLMEQQKMFWPNPIFPQLPEHIAFTAPLPTNCSFAHCPNESVQFAEKVVRSRLGASLRLRCHFQIQNVLAKDRFESNSTLANGHKVFVWPFSNFENERRWEEKPINGGDVDLVVGSLNRHHLGLVACRCWHCNSPRFDVTELRFWTPLSISVNVAVYGERTVEQSLLVHGYPLESLRLGIRFLQHNSTEWHEFSAKENEMLTFFNGSLLVRSELAHSHFFLRYFSIGIHECTDCRHSQIGGAFEFEVCREVTTENEQPKDSEGTPLSECAESVVVQLQPTKHPKSNSTGAIGSNSGAKLNPFILWIFIILFLILLLLAIGALTRTVVKEKKMKGRRGWRTRGHSQSTAETSVPLYTLSHCPSLPQQRHNLRVIDSQNLQLNQCIGNGAFGAVYEAIWTESEEKADGELGTSKRTELAEHSEGIEQRDARKVAMKFLTNVNFGAMEKEAALLSRLDHPNVLRMFGISYWKGEIALVLELMNSGDLRSFIRERAPSHGEYAKFPPALNYLELVDIAIQVAEGLCYLVLRQVVHRDLAARNCLVSGDSDHRCRNATLRPPIRVKISDFGMSRNLYSSMDYYKMSSKSTVPIRWTAPECLSNGKYTHQSDIWSFGVLLFELFSYGETPFGTFFSNENVWSALKNGAVPNVPERCSAEMAELMRNCWERIAEKRISAEEALGTLKDIRRKETEGKQRGC
ncbi:hypothetical protein niasHT_003737 [Heterodera trifolii]|uniref:Protein kinase domain-containing protein n=1 Tax=Heterodera trifolii TaxID=157864 RepID=A0ABD2LUU7_9BILA